MLPRDDRPCTVKSTKLIAMAMVRLDHCGLEGDTALEKIVIAPGISSQAQTDVIHMEKSLA